MAPDATRVDWGEKAMERSNYLKKAVFVAGAFGIFHAGSAFAADSVKGQVLLGGAPVAKSTVTLWEASAGSPKQLGRAKTNADGRFEVHGKGARADGILYLVSTGGASGRR